MPAQLLGRQPFEVAQELLPRLGQLGDVAAEPRAEARRWVAGEHNAGSIRRLLGHLALLSLDRHDVLILGVPPAGRRCRNPKRPWSRRRTYPPNGPVFVDFDLPFNITAKLEDADQGFGWGYTVRLLPTGWFTATSSRVDLQIRVVALAYTSLPVLVDFLPADTRYP